MCICIAHLKFLCNFYITEFHKKTYLFPVIVCILYTFAGNIKLQHDTYLSSFSMSENSKKNVGVRLQLALIEVFFETQ